MSVSAGWLFWSDTYDTLSLVLFITLVVPHSVAFVPQLPQQLQQQHAGAEGSPERVSGNPEKRLLQDTSEKYNSTTLGLS